MNKQQKIGWLVIAAALLFMVWKLPRLHGQGFGSFSHDQPFLAATGEVLPNETIPYFYATQSMGMPLTGAQQATNSTGYTLSLWLFPQNFVGTPFVTDPYYYMGQTDTYDTNTAVGTNHPILASSAQHRLQVFNNLPLRTNEWNHVLMAAGTNQTSPLIYVNDVRQPLKQDWIVGSNYTWSAATVASFGGYKFEGGVADLWFNNQYQDVSVESTRRKFILANGRPASLGNDGSTPLGTAPFIYVTGLSANFATNKGYAGGYFTYTNGPVSDVLKAGRQVSNTNQTILPTLTFAGLQGVTNKSNLGAAQSTGFTVSMWIKRRHTTSADIVPINWDGGSSGMYIGIYTNGVVKCQCYSPTDNMVYRFSPEIAILHAPPPIYSSRVYGAAAFATNGVFADVWHHILMACSGTSRRLWVDGVENSFTNAVAEGNVEIPWQNGVNFKIGNNFDRTPVDFQMAEVWIDLNWRDLSAASDRAKFITPDKWAVDLGVDGSAPFGTAPHVYLKTTGLTNNAGSGGNFVAYGSPVPGTNGPIKKP